MAADFLLKVAEVLEQLAHTVDAQDAEKTASEQQTRGLTVQALSERYAEATGEDLPDDVREKLAAADKDVLATVQRMIEKSAGSLGYPSDDPAGDPEPQTKSEKRQRAFERFGSFLIDA